MANFIDPYDPLIYAQEGLLQLEQALGMAGAVYRDMDKEPQQRGSTIQVKRPGTFAAEDMPSTTPQDIDPSTVDVTLDKWRGVQFKLTDKELSEGGEIIIRDHIRPAAYAVAEDIDTALNALYADIPWIQATASAGNEVDDFTGLGRIFRDNKVPDAQRYLEIGAEREEAYLGNSTFHQANTAGQAGLEAQVRGMLGTKFGFGSFVNQNTPSHTAGTFTDTGADAAIAAAAAKGATSVDISGSNLTGDLNKGDTFVIAGSTQRFAVTADATIAANAVTVSITPALDRALSGGEAVTVSQSDADVNIAFHRNAFVLAMAPLSELGNQLGARIATVADPRTGLALRSTLWYEEKDAEIWVRLDSLYGVKTLDPNLAARLENQS